MEFEQRRETDGTIGSALSQIYLVEFELAIIDVPFPDKPMSQIYLVEFEQRRVSKRAIIDHVGPKSTLWNLNEGRGSCGKPTSLCPKSTLWNLNPSRSANLSSFLNPSQIYLVEFEPTNRPIFPNTLYVSQIYLVEFERNYHVTPGRYCQQSQIYLVEFEPARIRTQHPRSLAGPKSTLWNLNENCKIYSFQGPVVPNLPCGI